MKPEANELMSQIQTPKHLERVVFTNTNTCPHKRTQKLKNMQITHIV